MDETYVQIGALAETFERRWSAGDRQAIEECLSGLAEPIYSAALHLLIGCELERLIAEGESPRLDDYQARFPRHVAVVAAAFDELRAAHADTSVRHAQKADTVPLTVAADPNGESSSRQFGCYTLLKVLGRGGMGVVYNAWDHRAKREVALKTINPDHLGMFDPTERAEFITRFRTEIQATANLQHENIVPVFDIGQQDGTPYYTMPLIRGQSLQQSIDEASIPLRTAVAVIRTVAAALGHAHGRDILHRDIKPGNILIESENGRPLIMDFGLARLTTEASDLTRTNVPIGTLRYMSPEQAVNSARVTARSDVYSLGATLYHAITGVTPFQGSSDVEVLDRIRSMDPVPPMRWNADIDRDLSTICMKCLEKDPRNRYPSAHALANDLDLYLAGRPIQARPLGLFGRVAKLYRRHPAAATLAVLLTLAIAAGLVAFGWQFSATLRAKNLATRNLSRAQDNLGTATEAIQFMTDEIASRRLASWPQASSTRRDIMERALRFHESLVQANSDDEFVLRGNARAYGRMGELHVALADLNAAETAYNSALAILSRITDITADDDTLLERSRALYGLAQVAAGRGLYANAGEMLDDVEQLLARVDVTAKRREVDQLRVGCLSCRYLAFLSSGNADEVESTARRAISIEEKQLATPYGDREWLHHCRLELAAWHSRLGAILRRTHRYESSAAEHRRAVELLTESVSRCPDWNRTDTESRLATAHRNFAITLRCLKQYQEAYTELRKAAGAFRQLMDEYPDSPHYQSELSAALHSMCQVAMDQAEWDEALRYITEALAHQRRAFVMGPESSDLKNRLKNQLYTLIEIQLARDDHGAAAKTNEEFLSLAMVPLDHLSSALVLADCAKIVKKVEKGSSATDTIDAYAERAFKIIDDASRQKQMSFSVLTEEILSGFSVFESHPDYQEFCATWRP